MRALILLSVSLVAILGCDVYDKPHRPVGDAFQARTLDGMVVNKSVLRQRPWAVSVWVPG